MKFSVHHSFLIVFSCLLELPVYDVYFMIYNLSPAHDLFPHQWSHSLPLFIISKTWWIFILCILFNRHKFFLSMFGSYSFTERLFFKVCVAVGGSLFLCIFKICWWINFGISLLFKYWKIFNSNQQIWGFSLWIES